MSDQVGHGISAAERGETIGRRWRILIRAAAVLVLVACLLGVALVRERAHDREREQSAPADTGGGGEKVDPLAHATREVELLGQEDARLRRATLGEAVGVTKVGRTVVLGARPAAYRLGDLLRAGAAKRVSASVVELVAPVTVRREARLVIDAPGTTLRLSSSAKGYPSLVAWGGSITLRGSKAKPLRVSGWDGVRKAPDTSTRNGRAYVRVKDGTLQVTDVELRNLGFWSGRTGGLAVTGSSETAAAARLVRVRMTDLHLGFYASGVHRLRADRVTVVRPQRHGIELSNRSEHVRIDRLVVRQPAEDGVSVSNGTSDVSIVRARVVGAGRFGLDVDGSPLAEGLNSPGYGVDNYAGLDLADSRFEDNADGGIRIRAVDHVEISGATVRSGPSAVVVRGAAKDVTVRDSELDSEEGNGLALLDQVTGATVADSTVAGREIGLEIDDSSASVTGNDITVGTGHGVRVSGDGSVEVADNTIHGRGAGAVSGRNGARIETVGESDGDWTYRPGFVLWVEQHSSAMPLLLIGVLPAVGMVFVLRRRRQQRELRRLFEESLVEQGRQALARYQPAVVGAEPGPAAPVVDPVPPALDGRVYATSRDFAIAAVQESGYSPAMVARVLNVPTSRVRDWVAEAASQG